MPIAKYRKTVITTALSLVVFAYFGSYLLLSMQGRYEPGAWGTNGVKWYVWVPKGFATDCEWRAYLQRLYAPLYALDVHFWHPFDDAYRGKHPVRWHREKRSKELRGPIAAGMEGHNIADQKADQFEE